MRGSPSTETLVASTISQTKIISQKLSSLRVEGNWLIEGVVLWADEVQSLLNSPIIGALIYIP